MDNEEIPDWIKSIMNNEEKFWNETYPAYSYEEKVKHWSGTLFRQMRSQGESGYDEYALYSPEWYAKVKKTEPEFDQIMEDVFANYWQGTWSKAEYYKRIGKSAS